MATHKADNGFSEKRKGQVDDKKDAPDLSQLAVPIFILHN